MEKISVKTNRRSELVEITGQVQAVVSQGKVNEGACMLFVPHTTAGITINENADPSVQQDMRSYFDELTPVRASYSHSEGNSDAHIKSSLLGNSLNIFIQDKKLCLGAWQGLFFVEGDGPRNREVWIKLIKEDA